jgi:hypothetical protein
MSTPRDVLLCEVIDEVLEIAAAWRAGIIAAIEHPPNMERVAAAMQRSEDAEESLKELREQQGETE